nr:hypothetical protein [Tanacetum cinerariifolium]
KMFALEVLAEEMLQFQVVAGVIVVLKTESRLKLGRPVWGKGMRLGTEASDSCDGCAIVNEDSKTVHVILRFLLLLFVVLCTILGQQ